MINLRQELESLQRISNYDREPDKSFRGEVSGGVCGDCNRSIRLRKNGGLFKHNHKQYPPGTCKGVGIVPECLRSACPICKQTMNVYTIEDGHYQMPAHKPLYRLRRAGQLQCDGSGMVGKFIATEKVIIY